MIPPIFGVLMRAYGISYNNCLSWQLLALTSLPGMIDSILNFVKKNYTWIFSGIRAIVIAGIGPGTWLVFSNRLKVEIF